MNDLTIARMTNEVNRRFQQDMRDKILDNMNLDDVPNLDIISEYINALDVESLLRICKVAEILDWQRVGRIIGVVGEYYHG